MTIPAEHVVHDEKGSVLIIDVAVDVANMHCYYESALGMIYESTFDRDQISRLHKAFVGMPEMLINFIHEKPEMTTTLDMAIAHWEIKYGKGNLELDIAIAKKVYNGDTSGFAALENENRISRKKIIVLEDRVARLEDVLEDYKQRTAELDKNLAQLAKFCMPQLLYGSDWGSTYEKPASERDKMGNGYYLNPPDCMYLLNMIRKHYDLDETIKDVKIEYLIFPSRNGDETVLDAIIKSGCDVNKLKHPHHGHIVFYIIHRVSEIHHNHEIKGMQACFRLVESMLDHGLDVRITNQAGIGLLEFVDGIIRQYTGSVPNGSHELYHQRRTKLTELRTRLVFAGAVKLHK
jgi:hypothetical protein